MDHVVALAGDAAVPETFVPPSTPAGYAPEPPELITLGKPDLRAFEAAQRIASYASARVATLRAPVA